MTKIKTIKVENYKAISNQEIDLNGASILVTGGNNQGKSSMLKDLIDRFRGQKPEIIVKEGEEKGFNIMELTDGSKIEWKFNQKNESFAFTTPDNFTIKTGVLKSIGKRYFGIKFDIDKFITSSQAEQTKMVQKLLGIDLSELDEKYSTKYTKRTEENKELNRLLNSKVIKPEEVKTTDLEALRAEKKNIEDSNTVLKNNWKKENEAHQASINEFNEEQEKISSNKEYIEENIGVLEKLKENDFFGKFINWDDKIEEEFKNLPEAQDKKILTTLDEPEYNSLEEIDKKIEEAITNNSLKDSYDEKLNSYNEWIASGEKQRKIVDKLNKELDKIKAERFELIKKSKLPADFELTENGLIYKGLPLENAQISSSAKYICALKLGALSLGELRTMHFDASYLDNISLKEIQEWAEKQDLQLLIERPDLDGGEITYKIV